MKIYDEIRTPFAKACQDKLPSSIAKGVSKHKAREEKIKAGSKRKSSGMLHADRTIDDYAGKVKRYAQWMAEVHPEIASLRLEEGHWEGDTVVGKRAADESVVFSLLEKKPPNLSRIPYLRQNQRGGTGAHEHPS